MGVTLFELVVNTEVGKHKQESEESTCSFLDICNMGMTIIEHGLTPVSHQPGF